jgi:hypothetical protein
MPEAIPQATATEIQMFRELAEHPEMVWESLKAFGDLHKVDIMLAGGATPEWILMRGEFRELQPEVATAFLNALHWRQAEIRKAGAIGLK